MNTNLQKSQKGKQNANKKNQEEKWKCFIGGLTSHMSKSKLKAYFKKFGKVKNVFIPYDTNLKKPKGYGFVDFADKESYDKALSQQTHQIKNVTFTVERVLSFEEATKRKNDQQNRKLFVRGLSQEVRKRDLNKYFSQFGKVEDILMQHKFKNGKKIFKEFGFVIMKNKSDLKKIIEFPNHFIKGNKIDVKKALAREDTVDSVSQDDEISSFNECINNLKTRRSQQTLAEKNKNDGENKIENLDSSSNLKLNLDMENDSYEFLLLQYQHGTRLNIEDIKVSPLFASLSSRKNSAFKYTENILTDALETTCYRGCHSLVFNKRSCFYR